MRFRRVAVCIAVAGVVWLGGMAVVAPRASSQSPGRNSEQVFKNVQVLKGIPVDDFIGTMGIMCAALGFDCSDCHADAGTEKVDWAADTPKKVIARRMVRMVASINRDNFAGRQVVTCWSCHHGRDRPSTTPALEHVYGPASEEMDDLRRQEPGQPAPDVIINKYLQAIGGLEKLASVKSYVAKGVSVGFGGFGGGGKVEIYAKFPDQRATFIEFPEAEDRDSSVRTYNGREGWLRTPLTVLGEYQLTGGELDGARIDALLSFPQQIKTALSRWRVSLPVNISDLPAPASQVSKDIGLQAVVGRDRLVNVVQGTGPRNSLVNLYFDHKSGLLVRMLRYANSPIGRIPTQVDYGDYRDVGGIKMPFRMVFAWLDGRDTIQLQQVEMNVPIDAAKFGKPPEDKH